MNSGIYKITNEANGKFYVGSAVSIKKRWHLHLLHLRRGTHKNPKLQASFNKNGEGVFRFDVLEICDIATLIPREQFWIDHLCAVAHGFNINPIAGNSAGRKFPFRNLSENHRRLIGESKKGKKRNSFSDEWREKLKTAAQRKRPRQSMAMKEIWAARPSRSCTVVCACGKSRHMLNSKRKDYPAKYQCRACYLKSRKSA